MSGNRMRELTPAEFLAHCTVKIDAILKGGETSIGTGFFYQFHTSTGYPILALITNRHVLEDATEIKLIFNPMDENMNFDPKGDKITYTITEIENGWHGHPQKDIDLAFILMETIKQKMVDDGIVPFLRFFRKEHIPLDREWEQMTALEDVVIVGYPDGVWDSVNNLPVFRKGITATHPSFNYENRPEFLIDAAIYPGSSGSPVILYSKQLQANEIGSYLPGKFDLLGVVWGIWAHDGEVKRKPIPSIKKTKPIVEIPNNLGIVIKANKINDFLPIIEQKFRDAIAKRNEKADRLANNG